MNCKEFKTHIDGYLLDPEFDWKLRYEMDDHLLNCEKCQMVYSISSLVTDESVMAEPIGGIPIIAYPGIWTSILLVYRVERFDLVALATMIGTPLVRILKTTSRLPKEE